MGVLLTDPALALADAELIDGRPGQADCSGSSPWLFIDRPQVAPREVTQTLIVCGDCGGDGLNPRKTFLTKQDRCASCGGRSYVLAANLEVARRVALALEQIAFIS
jgi:ribosomal protein L37E